MEQRRLTPEIINSLESDEVFVFGSNKSGAHMGGAARIAYEKFGAKWGAGEGEIGNSYAIPTLDGHLQKVSKEDLKGSISRFINHVLCNQNKIYLLTKIGCGIAGWSIEEVKEIFWKVIDEFRPDEEAILPSNLIIPKEFCY